MDPSNPDALDAAELRELYFSEAHNQLEHLSAALHRLERAHADRESLAEALRAAHTLKGMSAIIGYDAMTAAAHVLEELLQRVRERPSEEAASNLALLLDLLEHISQALAQIQAGDT